MVESSKRELEEVIQNTKVRIAILGATGAIGKEIVDAAKQSTHVEELFLIVRRPLEEWKQEDFTPKLTILQKENFDDFSDIREQLEGKVDACLCTLGARTKNGKEQFVLVDYTYPLNFAQFAKEINVPHFGLLTSAGAKASSMFLYMKTKGQVEDAVKALDLP